MTSSGGVFSQTLQEITTTKLEELAKKRASYEKSKAATLKNANSKKDPIDMLVALLDGTMSCFGVRTSDGKIVRGSSKKPRLETDLRNLRRFIDQARFDPSVSPKIIQQWRDTLQGHLEAQSLKYQYADLYGKLTVEWLTSSKSGAKTEKGDAMDVDDFEQVATKAKLEARQTWEKNVFTAAKVDASTITQFLDQTFEGDDAQKALKDLREKVSEKEDELLRPDQFNLYSLRWTINGLLASDLLTNEKRDALRDFLSNNSVLNELADVLNMRIAALDSWTWGHEVTVEARRQMNGKFHIYMHEDLLQAIFLQYIGVQWSVMLKKELLRFMWAGDVFKMGRKEFTPIDKQRWAWYLGSLGSGTNVQRERYHHYLGGYFASQLLNSVDQDLSIEEGDLEADFAEFATAAKKRKTMPVQSQMLQQAPSTVTYRERQAPRKQLASKAARRSAPAFEAYADEEEEEDDEDMGFGLFDDDEGDGHRTEPDLSSYRPANPMDARQKLLHLLATEILVKTRLHGEITCFRSQFDTLYPSLPHITIETVLSYLGVSEKWLTFFKSYLEAPLKFADEDTQPRLRKRGTPGAHVLSDVFAESVLFVLDITVNRQTEGDVLWRMSNDFWFWSSSHQTCVDVWDTIGRFNKIMGLELDDARSAAVRFQRKGGKLVPASLGKRLPDGDIRWGMLFLNPKTGRFTVDQSMVDKHIEELRRQLKDKEKSLFAWVQAYSTYASVFFTTNFGKTANCFGREHLDMMLGMHERIQKTLFSKSADGSVTSVVDWLKAQIEQRFGVKNVPDGYLFFPTELGGLDVKSPFVGPLQLRESVVQDPSNLLDDFEKAEREKYAQLKKTYLNKKPWEYPEKSGRYRPENPREFMPFEEYIKFREELHYGFGDELYDVYGKLLQRPEQEALEVSGNPEIEEMLVRCGENSTTTITYWHSMDAYWKWVTMLYGPEMMQRFGSFEIVDAGLLPMGMVSMFRSGRVSWQE